MSDETVPLTAAESRALTNERYGIGADEVIEQAERWRTRCLETALEVERLRNVMRSCASEMALLIPVAAPGWRGQIDTWVHRLRAEAKRVGFGGEERL